MKRSGKGPTRRLLMAGGAALAVSGCGRPLERPLLSSDTHPEGYPTVEAVKEMARLLRERTGGRLDIKIYAGGQLGSEPDTLEITTFGGLDLNRVNLSPLSSIEPMTVIPSLPFLFRSQEHLRATLDGAPGEEVLRSLDKHHIVGLCYYDSGERSFYNTLRPIHVPSDMRGMKIRVQNSDLFVVMIKALGADATPMAMGEVYQSLVQGVIDGAENNYPSYESGRHFEAAPYFSLSRHVMTPEILVMSKSRWDKLSKADQELVREAAKESVHYMRKLWDARVTDARARVLAAGAKENEVDDREAFARAMRPVWDQFITTDTMKRLVRQIEEMGLS
jgi:tripartite ATP-independent transporter DctP family solute receptor